MWLKWLPWKYIVSRLARSHGFIDPIALLSYVRRFSEPSEVTEPIELLRAGIVLHARGLINSRVIQHNLDWVWPYWVDQQFNPRSEAFIPRAFSLTHINLSARNWTSIGIPDFSMYPIVAPKGLVMPFWDSWSIDAWLITDNGKLFAPSRLEQNVEQKLILDKNISVVTISQTDELYLHNQADVILKDNEYICRINFSAKSKLPGWLVISPRPYNPEGISFIHTIHFYRENIRWRINDKHDVFLSDMPDKHLISDYRHGDVSLNLLSPDNGQLKITCNVGMATAAAMYRLEPERQRSVEVKIPLSKKVHKYSVEHNNKSADEIWSEALDGSCELHLSYKNFQFLYQAAIRSIVLHSPAEVYPGPFTYKRFWFRDATYIIYAMLSAGMIKHSRRLIENFFHKQTSLGYFHSQEGEWDSNGQVLWLMNKFCRLSGESPPESWYRHILNAAKWIIHKRTSKDSQKPHAGLMPAGFSAEHFGPNDYYYWDDFWSVAGLRAAANMLEGSVHEKEAAEFREQAGDLFDSIEKSLASCKQRLGTSAMPASPYRRLDSGIIGSLAACYPLDIFNPDDERIVNTVNYIMGNCIINNAFYHDISHSGINPYLSLHLAQVLMRMGDMRFISLAESIARYASGTGQWPEAINPRTGLGCMGDGQHVWASAELVLLMINSFIMKRDEKLVIGSGVFPSWLTKENKISIGPVMTDWGAVSITIHSEEDEVTVHWKGNWRIGIPSIEIRLPDCEPAFPNSNQTSVQVRRLVKK